MHLTNTIKYRNFHESGGTAILYMVGVKCHIKIKPELTSELCLYFRLR